MRLLYIGDAALARECLVGPGAAIEVLEAVPRAGRSLDLLAGTRPDRALPFDIVLIENVPGRVAALDILRDIRARKLDVPAVIVAEWNEELAVEALTLGAVDYLAKSRASFRAILFRLKRLLGHSTLLREHGELVETRRALEAKLTETEASYHLAEALRQAESTAAAEKLAQIQGEYAASLADARQARAPVEQRLNEMVASLEQVRQERSRFEGALSRETTNRKVLEEQLVIARLALQRAEADRQSELAATRARFAEDQARYDTCLADALAARDALYARLADLEAARRLAEERHSAEMTDALSRLTESEQTSSARSAEATATMAALQGKLADLAAALERADNQAAAERLAAAEASATALERAESQAAAERLAAAQASAAASATAERQLATERFAASEHLARRQAQFETELAQEIARRRAVEQEFADARAAFEAAERRFQDQVAAMRQRTREQETRLEERATRERAEWEGLIAEGQERNRQLQTEIDVARQSVFALHKQLQDREREHNDERAGFKRAQTTIETDLARQQEEYAALQRAAERANVTAAETLAGVIRDREAERGRFEALVAERDRQLREQADHKHVSDAAAAKALDNVEHRLRLAIEAGLRDGSVIAQLHDQIKARGEELEALTGQREVLKAEASRATMLARQIDELEAATRRRFAVVPISLCRCNADGVVTEVNHAMASLLGYESPDRLRQVEFAGAVFESGDELRLLLERCLASRSVESVETTWMKKDGSRLIVRLRACATTSDSIDLTAQDITAFRVLEERLRNSQRLEAVARFAAEIAVTCEKLLSAVEQEGSQWLAGIEPDVVRYQGQLLLDEVSRATAHLRQLMVYGNEQKKASELVDVNAALRDLAPVLKHVAGRHIDLILPNGSAPFTLDVEAERVERMFINVAAYSRKRMASGGRLRIDVAAVELDRHFVAKYPNVRPGTHVLITVNGTKRAPRPDGAVPDGQVAKPEVARPEVLTSLSDNPGVDLGTLQALVTDCGGHLWMTAQPTGHMMLKIHLPRRVSDRPDSSLPARPATRVESTGHRPSPRTARLPA